MDASSQFARVAPLWIEFERAVKQAAPIGEDMKERIDNLSDCISHSLIDKAHRIRKQRNALMHQGRPISSLDAWERDCRELIAALGRDHAAQPTVSLVICFKCGANNRVRPHADARRPICGKCGAVLTPSRRSTRAKEQASWHEPISRVDIGGADVDITVDRYSCKIRQAAGTVRDVQMWTEPRANRPCEGEHSTYIPQHVAFGGHPNDAIVHPASHQHVRVFVEFDGGEEKVFDFNDCMPFRSGHRITAKWVLYEGRWWLALFRNSSIGREIVDRSGLVMGSRLEDHRLVLALVALAVLLGSYASFAHVLPVLLVAGVTWFVSHTSRFAKFAAFQESVLSKISR